MRSIIGSSFKNVKAHRAMRVVGIFAKVKYVYIESLCESEQMQYGWIRWIGINEKHFANNWLIGHRAIGWKHDKIEQIDSLTSRIWYNIGAQVLKVLIYVTNLG